MAENNSIEQYLQQIATQENSPFDYNLDDIKAEYELRKANKSGIAIKLLSVLGGFLASLAFVGFLMLAGIYDSDEALTITGFVFVAGSIVLNIAFRKLIIDTFSISAYLIGLILITMGLGDIMLDANRLAVLLMAISFVTILFSRNYMLSFLSVLIINGGFIFLIVNNEQLHFIHVYNAIILGLLTAVFLGEAHLISLTKFTSRIYDPVRIGLIFSLLFGLIFVGQRGIYDFNIKYIWASSVITIPLTVYVIYKILKVMKITNLKQLVVIYSLSVIALLATGLSPAISGTLLVVLLSFFVQYRTGLAAGIVSFVYFISQYYYDLSFTLLTKSIILLVTGIIFLVFYLLVTAKLNLRKKVQ